MKVALVVGHTGRASGAYSSFLQESEFFYWSEIVHGINARLRFLGIDSKVFIHTTIPYNQRMNELAAKTRDFDLVVEFHFNGSVSNIANGTETLYFFNSSKGKQFASFFNEEICSWFGTTNRGIKALYNEQQNGFGFVYKTKPPAILLEPFFGSNESDSKKFSDKFDVIRKFVVIFESFKNNYFLN